MTFLILYWTVAITVFVYCNVKWAVSKTYRAKAWETLDLINVKTAVQREVLFLLLGLLWLVTLPIAAYGKYKEWDKE